MNTLNFTEKNLLFILDSNLVDMVEDFYRYVDFVKAQLNNLLQPGELMNVEKFQKYMTELFDIAKQFENMAWFQEMQFVKDNEHYENLAVVDQLKAML